MWNMMAVGLVARSSRLPIYILLLLACDSACVSAVPRVTRSSTVQIEDSCETNANCSHIDQAICDQTTSTCTCTSSHPIPDNNRCLTAVDISGACEASAQCRPRVTNAECSDGTCTCLQHHYLHTYADGLATCLPTSEHSANRNRVPVDPVMMIILASLILMFIIICAVLRIFSKARFRQNRTILNSANARLMNTNLFKQPNSANRRRPSMAVERRRSQAPSQISAVELPANPVLVTPAVEQGGSAGQSVGQSARRVSTTAEVTVEKHTTTAIEQTNEEA